MFIAKTSELKIGLRSRRKKTLLFLVTLVVLHSASVRCGETNGIEGRWLTFDSRTHAKRSTVEIVREGSWISGRIIALYLDPDETPDPVCGLCKGVDRGQKILGMRILSLQVADDGTHFRGEVLDPEEGRMYQCIVTLESREQRLNIRGYVGIQLFGRTEVWSRSD